ncbi:MAG: hypothetical protein Q9164_004073 [Protoblastenia rupestris]
MPFTHPSIPLRDIPSQRTTWPASLPTPSLQREYSFLPSDLNRIQCTINANQAGSRLLIPGNNASIPDADAAYVAYNVLSQKVERTIRNIPNQESSDDHSSLSSSSSASSTAAIPKKSNCLPSHKCNGWWKHLLPTIYTASEVSNGQTVLVRTCGKKENVDTMPLKLQQKAYELALELAKSHELAAHYRVHCRRWTELQRTLAGRIREDGSSKKEYTVGRLFRKYRDFVSKVKCGDVSGIGRVFVNEKGIPALLQRCEDLLLRNGWREIEVERLRIKGLNSKQAIRSSIAV